jgi:hypothetical protein
MQPNGDRDVSQGTTPPTPEEIARLEGSAAEGRRRGIRRTIAIALSIAASVGVVGAFSGCGDELSKAELAEMTRLTERLRVLCDRDGPLDPGGRRALAAPAAQIVERMMDLTKQAPDQEWVTDPEADSGGRTTPGDHLDYVGSDILGTSPDGKAEPCSSFLSGRVMQFLIGIDHQLIGF